MAFVGAVTGRGVLARLGGRAGVAWVAVLTCVGSMLAVPAAVAGGPGAVVKPSAPSALNLPGTPVVAGAAGSDLGYLPGSGKVSATGQYTYTIPIEVPAGRKGVQPHLSLGYDSGSGNGVLGVGWTLAGLSSITRCRMTLSTNGVTEGVHFTGFPPTPDTPADRFCLDGQQLMVANGGGYGLDGTQYRTEHDGNLKITSKASSSVAAAEGPDSFTVQSPDGSSLTYSPVAVTQYSATSSPTNGGLTAVGKVRATWVLTGEQDASGNGVRYTYNTANKPTDPCPGLDTQVLLCSIDYTTFNGDASGAQRHVVFGYEARTQKSDQEISWTAGVKSQLLERMTSIQMSAPDPAGSVPVWEYVIGYQSAVSSFSGRSLLASVQRCAVQGPGGKNPGQKGDCTWKKQFSYTQRGQAPSFVQGNMPSETNVEIAPTLISTGSNPKAVVQNYPEFAPTGPNSAFNIPPMLKVMSTTGDGHDDLLLQHGTTDDYLKKLQTWSSSPCNGNNVGATGTSSDPSTNPAGCNPPANIAPHLLLGSHTTQGSTTSPTSSAFVSNYDLSNTQSSGDFYNKDNQYNTNAALNQTAPVSGYPYYSNGLLENLTPFDPDGSGKSSLLMNDQSTGECGRLLDWVGGTSPGFHDRGVNYAGCLPASLHQPTDAWYPNPWNPTQAFPAADFTGSGRADMMKTKVLTIPAPLYYKEPVVQPAVNIGGNKTAADPTTTVGEISPNCPMYFGDFSGDGRTETLGYAWSLSGDSAAPHGLCGKAQVLSYNPFSGKAPDDSFVATADTTGSTALPHPLDWASVVSFPSASCPHEWNPANCNPSATDDPNTLFFGDFNGDGLTDVVVANYAAKTLSLRWNTGNGFSAPVSLGSPAWMTGAYSIKVADLNHDGRADLVVFHEQPTRAITVMMSNGDVSNGDGTFNSTDITAMNATSAADPGLRTLEGWTNSVLGDFNGDGNTGIAVLVGDPSQTLTLSDGQAVGGNGGQVYEHRATLWTLTQPTMQATMPSNGTYTQPTGDLMVGVSDENAKFSRETVSYASASAPSGAPAWSDKPESNLSCAAMQYPQRCLTSGLVTVRSVTSYDTTTKAATPVAHTVYYSYEQPVTDMRGRGFLGFTKVRVWDPTRLQQTITLYDNTTETGTSVPGTGMAGSNSYVPILFQPGYYPGAGQPTSVTTITAIPNASSPQTAPSLPVSASGQSGPGSGAGAKSVNARVEQTVYHNHLVRTNAGTTYLIEPVADGSTPAQVSTRWEAMVSMAGDVNDPADPSSDYMWGLGSYPLPVPDSAVKHTTTVQASCDVNGANPGTGTGACIDGFGNVTDSIAQASTGTGSSQINGAKVQTVTTYNNLTAPGWVIGQPTSSTVTDQEPDSSVPVVSRKTVTDYTSAAPGQPPVLPQDSYTCRQVTPAASDANCGSFEKVATTTVGYDQYGNPVSASTTAQGPDGKQDTRQVNTEYDPAFPGQPDERIFPSQSWVPSDYPGTTKAPSSWQAVQPAYGVTVASEDVNGVQSQATFDDQGRPLTTTPPGAFTTPATGIPTSYSYAPLYDTGIGGTDGLVATTTTGGATSTVSTDSAGRTVLAQHLGFDGKTVDTSTGYDPLGRAVKTSRPYSDGASPQFFGTSVYDGLDRVLSTTGPDQKTTNHNWSFFTAQQADANGITHQVAQAFTTDPSGHQTRVDTDVDGNVIASGTLMPDPAPATTSSWQLQTFHYQTFGLQDTTKTPTGAISTTSFDTLGRITGSTSPDAGTTTGYVYDGFGELLSQNHQASGATAPDSSTSYTYEPALGRELGWTTTEGLTQTSATFSYDTAQNGLGKLAGAISNSGVAYGYGYDTAGRQNATTENIGGTNYTTSQTYNAKGQPDTLNYPAIGANPNPGLTLSYAYTTSEYPQTVNYQAANPTSQTMSAPAGLWKINSRYNDGTLSSAGSPASGAGVQIHQQQSPDSGRISEITATSGTATSPAMDLQYAYTDNGQIQTRTDLVNGRTEGYTYDNADRLTGWALATCTAAPCTPQAANTATTSYTYNNDGNLQTVNRSPAPAVQATTIQNNTYSATATNTGPQGGPHALDTQTGTNTSTYTYDSHGRQTQSAGRNLTYNACNLPTTVTQGTSAWTFTYGPFCERATKQGPDGTTTYIGSLYEHRTPASAKGITVNVFLIPGIGQVWVNAHGNTAVQYQVTDTQGSTGLVVDGASGTVVTGPTFYDPFGAPINKDGTPNTTPNTGPVTKGFTGQEQDTFGLDNYNGRLYDPTAKRFTTTDPHITNPLNPQNHNPYSYVGNNPVNATDPTGYDELGLSFGSTNNNGFSADGTTFTDANGGVWTWNPVDQTWRPAGSSACFSTDGTIDTATPQVQARTTPTPLTAGTTPTTTTTTPAPGPIPTDANQVDNGPTAGHEAWGTPYTQTFWQDLQDTGDKLLDLEALSPNPALALAGNIAHSVGSFFKVSDPRGVQNPLYPAITQQEASEAAAVASTALTLGATALEASLAEGGLPAAELGQVGADLRVPAFTPSQGVSTEMAQAAAQDAANAAEILPPGASIETPTLTYGDGYNLGRDSAAAGYTTALGKFPGNVDLVNANPAFSTIDRPFGWSPGYNAGYIRGAMDAGGSFQFTSENFTGTFGKEAAQLLTPTP